MQIHTRVLFFIGCLTLAACQQPVMTDYRSAAGSMDQMPGTPTGTPVPGGSTTGTPTVTPVPTGTTAGGTIDPTTGRQTVSFPGSRGDTVPAYLYLPTNTGAQRFPAVLLMYGISGDKNDGTINQAAQILRGSGIASLIIDWPGTGDRGKIENQMRITDKSVMDWTVADYGASFNYLKSLPTIDPARLGYVGASMGAMTGIVFAARTPDVKAIVALVPILDPLWLQDDPWARIKQLPPRPVLCVSSNGDMGASSTVCSGVSNHVHMNVEHELDGVEQQVIQLTKDFLAKSL